MSGKHQGRFGFARFVRRREPRSTRLRQSSLRAAQALSGFIAGVASVRFRFAIDFMRRPIAQVFPSGDRIPVPIIPPVFSGRNSGREAPKSDDFALYFGLRICWFAGSQVRSIKGRAMPIPREKVAEYHRARRARIRAEKEAIERAGRLVFATHAPSEFGYRGGTKPKPAAPTSAPHFPVPALAPAPPSTPAAPRLPWSRSVDAPDPGSFPKAFDTPRRPT
jgi:hypothetical protein